MKITTTIAIFCVISTTAGIYGQPVFDPFERVETFADKLQSGVQQMAQGVRDTFKPMTKVLKKAGKRMFGGLNEGLFNIERGAIVGLDEVVGVPVNTEDVTFYLATSTNIKNPTKVDYYNPADVADTQGKILMIIHGWTSNRNATWYEELTQVLLRKYPDGHVVQVDWHKPAADSYPFAAFSTESVGNLIGVFLNNIVTRYRFPTENLVLIGHSLGGQICGFTAKKFKDLTGKQLPRIVALDPAGPLFTLRPDTRRLNKHDAEVVMVIHTDGGILGFPSSCGTVDFFPNGGTDQPGCAKVNVIDAKTLLNPLSCCHLRSYQYLIEAVNSTNAFTARKCPSYTHFLHNQDCENVLANMGDLEEDARGSFYLKTSSISPFSRVLNSLIADIKNGAKVVETSISNQFRGSQGDVQDTVIDVSGGGHVRQKSSDVRGGRRYKVETIVEERS